MDQTEARQLARKLNDMKWLTWVATTRDRFHGRWEQTHEWGVATNDGMFYASVEELPGHVKDKLNA